VTPLGEILSSLPELHNLVFMEAIREKECAVDGIDQRSHGLVTLSKSLANGLFEAL
jgi:hypothetical protein